MNIKERIKAWVANVEKRASSWGNPKMNVNIEKEMVVRRPDGSIKHKIKL